MHKKLMYNYRPQRSCGKVMFCLSFYPQGGCGRQTPPWADSPPRQAEPPDRQIPPRDSHCSGQYASYCNAFLFIYWYWKQTMHMNSFRRAAQLSHQMIFCKIIPSSPSVEWHVAVVQYSSFSRISLDPISSIHSKNIGDKMTDIYEKCTSLQLRWRPVTKYSNRHVPASCRLPLVNLSCSIINMSTDVSVW